MAPAVKRTPRASGDGKKRSPSKRAASPSKSSEQETDRPAVVAGLAESPRFANARPESEVEPSGQVAQAFAEEYEIVRKDILAFAELGAAFNELAQQKAALEADRKAFEAEKAKRPQGDLAV